MKNDLTIELSAGILNVRVAAWIQKDGQLLVSTFPDGTISLPGGRVAFGESSLEAIQREILEETGTSILNVEMFAIIENFFRLDVSFHEFLFIYKGDIDSDNFHSKVDEEQTISWIPLEEVNKLKPDSLQQLVNQVQTSQIIHLINND